MRLLLHDILAPACIRTPLRGTTKAEILRELVEILCEAGAVDEVEPVLAAVLAREATLSTGIGSGVGIPHGKTERVRTLAMAAGTTAHPVDFEALDGKPCSLFFLLVGPLSAAGAHVKALANISRLVRRDEVRASLAAARSPQEFFAVVEQAEAE